MYTGAALIAALFLAQSAVPAGTFIAARLETGVKTATSKVGDEVVASLARNISLTDTVVVPKGSLLRGRVETIQPATRDTAGRVRLVFREIEFLNGRRVQTWVTNSFSAGTPKRNARYAVYIGLGATAGGLIGRKTARVAGILGGALAGFVIAGNRDTHTFPELTLKAGQQIELQLGEDLVVARRGGQSGMTTPPAPVLTLNGAATPPFQGGDHLPSGIIPARQ